MDSSKMSGASADISEEQKNKLRELFPEVFSEDKINWQKLKATLGEEAELGEQYGLSWKGKGDTFRIIQEPTTKTLKPMRSESVNFDETENVFIEGDNLEVLKVLQKAYYGKIKMIYIDPPYNTGNDFVYNDKFAQRRADYEQESGLRDEAGYSTRADGLTKTSKDGGHYHSDWLNMIYPRLYLARNLMKQDGLIFVSIDDNEVHNLRHIMDEIFGEHNFITDIIWEKRFTRSNDAKLMASLVDHTLLYRKTEDLTVLREARSEKADSIYSNPDNDPRGPWTSVSYVSQRTKEQRPRLSYEVKNPYTQAVIVHPTNAWKFSQEQHLKHIEDERLYWGKNGGHTYPRLKKYLSELEGKGMVPVNLWNYKETGSIDEGTKEVDSLIGKDIFDYPKPTRLIERMLSMATGPNDIVLDFFSGSGTTAHAVMQLNSKEHGHRKWISVQLPEETDPGSNARKAGHPTIADIARERIRRAGQELSQDGHENLDTGFKALRLADTNLKIWDNTVKNSDLRQQLFDHLNPIKDGVSEEELVIELALKSGIDLTTPYEKIESSNGKYYLLDKSLVICLEEKLSLQIFEDVISMKPKKVILLDSSLHNDDQLKTNLLLQAEKANIEVTVI